ncbi:FG-GAP-like repeat-containing protein [Haloarcula onubensis]|uniref:PQQ-like beta-propeller repeat protein n=1 Tax=Haloarcula onubensis TaxID=2950539 RepID=A0ABU2FRL3_9EURY|nr:FG-GAP-like repeat-containing protein [Halomicroarcula sp. S3CR25-11]MDS0283410.1 PQQ-like beta-propeller repeat protein [Halomicroarcula sp. S3CR25-11]
MRPRTALTAALCCSLLAGVVVAGLAAGGGTLTQTWSSDTARDNEVNHHSVGVGPGGDVVVAPVAAVPNAEPIGPTSCSLVRLRPSDGAVTWRWSVPAADCFTHALTQPAIADIDGDGGLEVAVGTTLDALVVLDAATGGEEWRLPLSTYGYGQPAVGNLSGDARPEVVVSDIDGALVVARGNGSVAWRADANMTVWARPRLVDVDGDGRREVVLGGDDGVVVYGADGTERWRSETRAKTLAVGDDGTVLAGDTGQLVAADGATGERVWQRSVDGTPRMHDVGDADGDGEPELYATVAGRVMAVETADGERDWVTDLGGSERQSSFAPVLGDVDGDGATDVIAVANDGTVAVLDGATGAERAAFERSVPIWTFATASDLDGDGDDEILVQYGDGRVVALDWTERGTLEPTAGR